MNKKFIISLPLFSFVALGALSGCASSENTNKTILRVLNSEDYIYLHNEKDGYYEPDLTRQFEDYIANDPELKAKYGEVQVVYDTADTMENIYSEMQTGKSNYDLICASDYIVAKMIRYGLVSPIQKELIPNYFGDEENSPKASKVLTDTVNQIITKPIKGDYIGQEQSLGDYTVGYMWGTLGFLFNPGYEKYASQGIDPDTVIEDMAHYDTVWNKYTNTIAIKDSMRDTFALGLMHAYHDGYTDKDGVAHDGFDAMRKKFYEDQSPLHEIYSEEEYNKDFSKLFNYVTSKESDPNKVINDVVTELNSLKKNIFGLEVDSGKQDIVTGKIGINWAWSGDAVYSMDQAEDPTQVSDISYLYYSIPDTGSNLWMDLWVAPKLPNNKQSDVQWELAHEFLNYLSDPEIAYMNMDYTGYTSFIAGDSIIDLVRDWYDVRTPEVYFIDKYEDYYDVFAVSTDVEEVTREIILNEEFAYQVDYVDLLGREHDASIDDWRLYYEIAEVNEDESVSYSYERVPLGDAYKLYGDIELYDNSEEVSKYDIKFFDEEGEEYDIFAINDSLEDVTEETFKDAANSSLITENDCVINSHDEKKDSWDLYYVTRDEMGEIVDFALLPLEHAYKYYGELTIVDEGDFEEVDLQYFFDETLDEYDISDAVFYSDEYSCFTIENEGGTNEICVGRQFFAQYPDETTLNRCAVMQDYEDYNDAIMRMWEDFKSDPLPGWAIALFAILGALVIGAGIYLVSNKTIKKRLRNRRKQENI